MLETWDRRETIDKWLLSFFILCRIFLFYTVSYATIIKLAGIWFHLLVYRICCNSHIWCEHLWYVLIKVSSMLLFSTRTAACFCLALCILLFSVTSFFNTRYLGSLHETMPSLVLRALSWVEALCLWSMWPVSEVDSIGLYIFTAKETEIRVVEQLSNCLLLVRVAAIVKPYNWLQSQHWMDWFWFSSLGNDHPTSFHETL